MTFATVIQCQQHWLQVLQHHQENNRGILKYKINKVKIKQIIFKALKEKTRLQPLQKERHFEPLRKEKRFERRFEPLRQQN